MVKYEKEHGFKGMIKDGLSYISQAISANIFLKIAEGTEMVMDNIDDRIIRIEKRISRKIYSLLMMAFGGVFLIFALFFYMKEFLGWNNTAAYFSTGIIVFIIGVLLKAGESDRRKNGS